MKMSQSMTRTATIAKFALGAKVAKDAFGREVVVMVTRAEFTYRGKRYAVVPCPGNAHSVEVAGNQDHCSLCMPLWGVCVEGPL